MSACPYCGDTRLSFNPRPTRQFDEGDLFTCAGCGAGGESEDLITDPDPEAHPYFGDGTSACAICGYPMNAHLESKNYRV